MFTAARLSAGLLAMLLAGCAQPPRRNLQHVPDWQSGEAKPFQAPAPVAASAGPPRRNAEGPSTLSNRAASATANTWVSIPEWLNASGAGALQRVENGSAPGYRLEAEHGRLELRSGSRIAHWNGVELRLGFAPMELEREPFLHRLDLAKTIEPLLAASGAGPAHSIVLDPGHGGNDCGARSVLGQGCEKDYTLDWALRLRDLLTQQGWQVSLTRETDAEVALTNRVAFATTQKAALFVSLHFNSAAPNHTEAGLETYCLTPAGMPSTLTRGYADEVSDPFPNNAFDAENLRVAVRLHTALLRANGNADRGVRRVRFPAVLRGQQCPAVLIEGGYLSNPREAELIAQGAYRQKLAEAVARGLNGLEFP